MAPAFGASPALLAQMAERMAARTQFAEEVASAMTRRTVGEIVLVISQDLPW